MRINRIGGADSHPIRSAPKASTVVGERYGAATVTTMETAAEPKKQANSALQFIADAVEAHRNRGRRLERAHYIALAAALISTTLSALSVMTDGELSVVLSLLAVTLGAVGLDLVFKPARKARRHRELSAALEVIGIKLEQQSRRGLTRELAQWHRATAEVGKLDRLQLLALYRRILTEVDRKEQASTEEEGPGEGSGQRRAEAREQHGRARHSRRPGPPERHLNLDVTPTAPDAKPPKPSPPRPQRTGDDEDDESRTD